MKRLRVDPVAVIYVALCMCIAAALCYCKPEPPKPTPTPTPLPECQCVIPHATDPGWEGVAVEGPPYGETLVSKAREAIGDRCGKDENETLALVAAQLAVQHVCALGPWADAVLVARPDGFFEEWHMVEWAQGCWYPLSKAYKGAWSHPGAIAKCK